MNRTKFRFKDYVSVSLPLPKLPKSVRGLPSRTGFDVLHRLCRDTDFLCVYLTARNFVATRRTNQLVRVRFIQYVNSRWADERTIQVILPDGRRQEVRPEQLYFIHEEEARNGAAT